MTYELTFDEYAIKYLNRLEKKLRKRIFHKIMEKKSNPMHYYERLSSRQDFKLRIGDYRVIVDIDFSYKKIKVTKIGHGKNVYE